jgi:hypothetical protein
VLVCPKPVKCKRETKWAKREKRRGGQDSRGGFREAQSNGNEMAVETKRLSTLRSCLNNFFFFKVRPGPVFIRWQFSSSDGQCPTPAHRVEKGSPSIERFLASDSRRLRVISSRRLEAGESAL